MKDQEDKIQGSISEQDKRFNDLVARYPYLKEARDYGVDIQMLIDNANHSVTERIKRHNIALQTFKKMRKAKILR